MEVIGALLMRKHVRRTGDTHWGLCVQDSSAGRTGMWLNLTFLPLGFFLYAVTPQVEIDGVVSALAWGKHFIQMPAGHHTIRVWFAYMSMPHRGLAQIDFDLGQDQVAQVTYFVPPWMYAPGEISLVGMTTAQLGVAAAWLTDPSGRHEYRYWDGTRWTDAVADNGIQSTESLEVSADARPDA